jgi:uncharacterized protein
METILITGGTGLVGTALGQALLQKGYRVIILTRELPATKNPADPFQYALWDVTRQTIDKSALAAADHIVHLAGMNLADKRWTNRIKKMIVDSRVESSRLLVNSLKTTSNKVRTLVSTSAMGWYGDDDQGPARPFIETDPPADGFLASVCKQWEASIEPITEQGIRLVKLRVGVVLSEKGGALKEFMKPVKWGVAGILGGGKQIVSWIHIDDLARMYIAAIEKENMHGVYNAVAPLPVSNRELVVKLAKSSKSFYVPVRVPAFAIKLLLGEMSVEVLKSTTLSAKKILDTGFQFDFPSIDTALKDIVGH